VIDAELTRFENWLASQEILPTVAALRERGQQIVEQVLDENSGRWESLSAADRERLRTMAGAIVSRMLHEPTLRMKRIEESAAYVYVHALRELFGLDARAEPTDAEEAGTVTPIRRRAKGEGA
jgi:glutamyl-tRNA reductase